MVDAEFVEVELGKLIGLPDAFGACCRASRSEAIEGGQDARFARSLGRLQHPAGVSGIGHNRYAVGGQGS